VARIKAVEDERVSRRGIRVAGLMGEADFPVTVASSPARGRPPQAAARRAGLEVVEKLQTSAASKGLPDAERGHQADGDVEAPCQSPLSGVVEVGVRGSLVFG
jgi:hypothetical protein